MRELVTTQTRDIERAFAMDSGPYQVADRYSESKMDSQTWIKKSKAFKEKFVKKVHQIIVRPVIVASATCNSSAPDESVVADKTQVYSLSINYSVANLPKEIIEPIWSKAGKILSNGGMICNVPGMENGKMVGSSSDPTKPHILKLFHNGKIQCDCLGFKIHLWSYSCSS